MTNSSNLVGSNLRVMQDWPSLLTAVERALKDLENPDMDSRELALKILEHLEILEGVSP